MKGFTGREVFDCWQRAQLKVMPGQTDTIDCLATEINTLLPALIEAEIERRLSEAEIMYLRKTPQSTGLFTQYRNKDELWQGDESPHFSKVTHKAKLFAITPIGEPWSWEKGK